jgi:hypothetical protein
MGVGRLAVGVGVVSVVVFAACGDRGGVGAPLVGNPAGGAGGHGARSGDDPVAGARGSAAAGGGRGATSPPPTRGNIPPLTGFVPGSVCETEASGRWCWYNPLPSGTGWLTAGSAGPLDIWVAGTGDALHFDGRDWTVVPTPLGRVNGVWGASRDDVWAVGWVRGDAPDHLIATIAHGDGQTFQIAYQNESSGFKSVWGSGPNDVWVVGDFNVVHWDGQTWTREQGVFDGRFLTGWTVDGSGPDDVWMGGFEGLWHFDGVTWARVAPFGVSSFIFAIAVQARNDVWASVIENGATTIHHFDGTAWTQSYTIPNNAFGIDDIDARAADDVWAVGTESRDGVPNRARGVLLHFDGVTWTRAPDAPTPMRAVLSLPLTHVAVGTGGRVLELSRGPIPGATELTSGTEQPLRGVWGAAGGDVWTVGAGGVALRLAAAPPLPAGGPAWLPFPTGTTANLRAVFTAAPNDVWIGGEAGTLLHWNGATIMSVTLPDTPPFAAISDIHGSAPDDIWLLGSTGLAAGESFASHFDGSAWSPAEILPQSAVGGGRIWRVSPTDVWALTMPAPRDYAQEFIWHFDGNAWTPRPDASSAEMWMFPFPEIDNGAATFPLGTFAFGPDDVWATSTLGTLARRTP